MIYVTQVIGYLHELTSDHRIIDDIVFPPVDEIVVHRVDERIGSVLWVGLASAPAGSAQPILATLALHHPLRDGEQFHMELEGALVEFTDEMLRIRGGELRGLFASDSNSAWPDAPCPRCGGPTDPSWYCSEGYCPECCAATDRDA